MPLKSRPLLDVRGHSPSTAELRSLWEKPGIEGRVPQQLHVSDDPSRDDGDRHRPCGCRPAAGAGNPAAVRRRPAGLVTEKTDLIVALSYSHAHMLPLEVERMRQDYAQTPDPAACCPSPSS